MTAVIVLGLGVAFAAALGFASEAVSAYAEHRRDLARRRRS